VSDTSPRRHLIGITSTFRNVIPNHVDEISQPREQSDWFFFEPAQI